MPGLSLVRSYARSRAWVLERRLLLAAFAAWAAQAAAPGARRRRARARLIRSAVLVVEVRCAFLARQCFWRWRLWYRAGHFFLARQHMLQQQQRQREAAARMVPNHQCASASWR